MTKRKKKRPSRKRTQDELTVGIAWYTPDQWERVKLLADDADALDDTYNDWLKNAGGHLRRFKQHGCQDGRIVDKMAQNLLILPIYPFDKDNSPIRLPQEIEAQLQQLARTGRKIEAVR